MSVNLLTRSILAMTGTVLSLGAVAINPAVAARITYNFSIGELNPDDFPFPSGPFIYDSSSPFTGRFSYDEATKVVTEYEDYHPQVFGPLNYVIEEYEVDFIEFSFLDRIYTQADAISPIIWRITSINDWGYYPILSWETEDFRFSETSYIVDEWSLFITKNPRTVNSVAFRQVSGGGEEPTPVPEPSILGAFSVLGLAGLLRKKQVKIEE